MAINNQGEAAGMTGTCEAFNLVLGYYLKPLHAVLWQKDGTPIDLGSLAGNAQSLMGTGVLAVWKDADADLPVLHQARTELARLR